MNRMEKRRENIRGKRAVARLAAVRLFPSSLRRPRLPWMVSWRTRAIDRRREIRTVSLLIARCSIERRPSQRREEEEEERKAVWGR